MEKVKGNYEQVVTEAIDIYIKAYNAKIIPILLTVISTVLGLTPFLLGGKTGSFWFALAAGTIGGLLPVSLLPDIQIPEITVQVSHPNTSASELENTVVRLLRQQLLQVARLSDIESEARDGNAMIRLRFTHGSNMDYLYIEVNEKIDAVMGNLPRDMERPRVIKASASDIPVFYLNLFMDRPAGDQGISRFLELSEFADWVIRKRIEQLPEVAIVDASLYFIPLVYWYFYRNSEPVTN